VKLVEEIMMDRDIPDPQVGWGALCMQHKLKSAQPACATSYAGWKVTSVTLQRGAHARACLPLRASMVCAHACSKCAQGVDGGESALQLVQV